MLKHAFTNNMNNTLTCWPSLPVVRKLKQTLVYIGLLNFCPSVRRRNSSRYMGSRSHRDSRSGSLLSSPWCAACAEVVTQHCDFLPDEKFPPYLQSNGQGQHLQAVYVHTQCLNALGNAVWKYFPWHEPPSPVRQASQVMMLSGLDQNLSRIKDTPL